LDSNALTEAIKNMLSPQEQLSKKSLFTLSNVLANKDIASESVAKRVVSVSMLTCVLCFADKFIEQKGTPDLIKSVQTSKGNTLGTVCDVTYCSLLAIALTKSLAFLQRTRCAL
jgi:hypothetical protein